MNAGIAQLVERNLAAKPPLLCPFTCPEFCCPEFWLAWCPGDLKPLAGDLWAVLADKVQSRLTECDVCRLAWQALSLVCVLAIPKQKRPLLITEGGVAGL